MSATGVSKWISRGSSSVLARVVCSKFLEVGVIFIILWVMCRFTNTNLSQEITIALRIHTPKKHDSSSRKAVFPMIVEVNSKTADKLKLIMTMTLRRCLVMLALKVKPNLSLVLLLLLLLLRPQLLRKKPRAVQRASRRRLANKSRSLILSF
jgi:hypothetical protein